MIKKEPYTRYAPVEIQNALNRFVAHVPVIRVNERAMAVHILNLEKTIFELRQKLEKENPK